jgi:hypothetical protein
MPFTGTIIAEIENDLIGPANKAQVGFAFNTALSVEQCAAAIVGYLGGIQGAFATGTKLVALKARGAGTVGAISLGFPVVEYNALRALATGSFPAITSYGTLPGSLVGGGGSLAPLGTSLSVTEQTLTPGPRGRGRHYLPYMAAGNVAANGGASTALVTLVKSQWEKAMGLSDLGASQLAPQVKPCVTRAPVAVGPNPYYDIASIKAQPVFSNLRSRRR